MSSISQARSATAPARHRGQAVAATPFGEAVWPGPARAKHLHCIVVPASIRSSWLGLRLKRGDAGGAFRAAGGRARQPQTPAWESVAASARPWRALFCSEQSVARGRRLQDGRESVRDGRGSRRDRGRAAGVSLSNASTRGRSAGSRSLGVKGGWRCLEVGAGHGSIARWLSERVGPAGSVVAVDVDTGFLAGLPDNVDVRELDIRDLDIEPDFDLAHCRALLMHLSDPADALARIVAALRPGGVLLAEEGDFGLAALRRSSQLACPERRASADDGRHARSPDHGRLLRAHAPGNDARARS